MTNILSGKKLWIYRAVVVVLAAIFIFAASKFAVYDEVYSEYLGTAVKAYGLESDVEYSQTFYVSGEALTSVGIQFGTMARINVGMMDVCFYEGDNLLKQWSVMTENVVDNQYYDFDVSDVTSSGDHYYTISVKDVFEGDNQLLVWTYGGNRLVETSDGEGRNYSLCLKLSARESGLSRVKFALCVASALAIAAIFLLINKFDSPEKALKYAILIVYFAMNFYFAYYHEAWRDEAQHWLIGKNLTTPEIFATLSNEGHPVLWLLIIKVVSLLGFKFKYFSFLSLAIMTGAAWILLFKSKLPALIDAAILASPVFMYYNAAISRNYCITVFFVLLCACLRRSRFEHPYRYAVAIACLFQTHTLVLGVALALCAELVWDLLLPVLTKKKQENINFKNRLLSIIIPAVSLIVLLAELYQGDKPAYAKISFSSVVEQLTDIPSIRFGLICVSDTLSGKTLTYTFWAIEAVFVVMLFAVVFASGKFKKLYRELIMVLIAKLTYLAIAIGVKNATHAPMASMYVLITVFALWIFADSVLGDADFRPGKVGIAALSMVFVVSMLFMLPQLTHDIELDVDGRFSNSKTMAQYILENTPEDSVFLVTEIDPYVTSVVAYVEDYRDDAFYSVDRQVEYKSHVWADWGTMTREDIERAASSLTDADHIYYLTGFNEDLGYAAVYDASLETPYSEKYYLFEIS